MTSTSIHQSSQVPKTSYSQGSTRRDSTSGTKLRDSCHACALSKVKCHKQKPTCSRCTKRGIVCEYFVTKRPGRKRDSTHAANNDSHGDTIKVARPVSSGGQDAWLGTTGSTAAYSTFSGSHDYLNPSDLSPTSPRPNNGSGTEQSTSSDIFSSLLMPLEHYSSELMGMNNEFDDFFDSPIAFSDLEALDPRIFSHGRSDIAKLLIPNDTSPEFLSGPSSVQFSNASKPTSPSNGRALSSSGTSMSGVSESCNCLIQALDLMKKLSSPNSGTSPPSNYTPTSKTSPTGHVVCTAVPSAHDVVVENKQTIEILSNMLQCSCAEDGYLLMVLSMIVFRIVGQYAAVALGEPGGDAENGEKSHDNVSGKEKRKRLSSFAPDNEGFRRRAAQLILSELHRVQRLVNDLSLRLKAHGRAEGNTNNDGGVMIARNCGWETQIPTLSDHLTKAAPFSTARFAQLEVDMRTCLTTLSSEIISMLRQS